MLETTSCVVAACDGCGVFWDEFGDGVAHFETAAEAHRDLRTHGHWHVNTDGSLRCADCLSLDACAAEGHDWGRWWPCMCQDRVRINRITGELTVTCPDRGRSCLRCHSHEHTHHTDRSHDRTQEVTA